MKSLLSFELV